ncbi:MAG: glycosyltransferase [Chitinophagaceae bacterium]|nr:glycosyltransferase [Chitinophagaceae bacterium]
MDQQLHIVCLQVPYPPDYGGVVDLFWKLKYLHEKGVVIHLHCFDHGIGQQDALLQYCKTVRYYKRKKGITAIKWRIPYIVSSRISNDLAKTLLQDNHPVLLEGIHCSWLLHTGVLKNRKVLLRLHNVEWDYYRQLGKTSTSLFHKWYYLLESRLLKKYEPAVIKKASAGLAVSAKDAAYWQATGQLHNVQVLPVFVSWNEITSKEGKGNYCLYHGNLSVAENEKAAMWLIKEIFPRLADTLFVIAGKNPSPALVKTVQAHKNIQLVANPSMEAMENLITEAHIHLLPSFTDSGIKLKLLHALFCGRFCITNPAMVAGTGLDNICIVVNTTADFINATEKCLKENFSASHSKEREWVLQELVNNKKNIAALVRLL